MKTCSVDHGKVYLGYLSGLSIFILSILRSLSIQYATSVMEQTDALLNESDTKLFRRGKDSRIILAATWRRDVLSSRTSSPVDVVDKGELESQYMFRSGMGKNIRRHR